VSFKKQFTKHQNFFVWLIFFSVRVHYWLWLA